VARLAIGKTIVGKGGVGPGAGVIVTVGTLASIVVWRCIGGMAGLAINIGIVSNSDVGPGDGAIVTVGTLASIVV